MQHLDPKEIYLKVLDIHIKKLKRGEKCYLYSGRINKEDIIGYDETDGLLEIVQIDSVKDVRAVSYDFVTDIARMETYIVKANKIRENFSS